MIQLTYALGGSGWADATVTDGSRVLHLSASYVAGDALRDLVEATLAVVRDRAPSAGFDWFEEPELDRWQLRRDGDTLIVSIRRFPEGPGHRVRPSDVGELLFGGRTTLTEFATQVVTQLEILLRDWGLEGYHRQWGGPRRRARNAFPLDAYSELRRTLGLPPHPELGSGC